MSHRFNRRQRRAAPSRLTLMSAAAVCALSLGAPAFAQDAQAESDAVEEVVVTGFRGLTKSIQDIKANNVATVDALTQPQIERMPDRSLAEILDRIVGVSSDRGFSSSQPRSATLRGFDARYNSMEVDGNLIWNSSRNNRGTQLDVFPASVVNQVNVFKTVTPNMDANSIGGHIELRTLRAFDGGSRSYLKARAAIGVHEQSGRPEGSRGSFRGDVAGKFTFGDENNLGVVLGAEYQQLQFFDRYSEVTTYSTVGGVDVINGSLFPGVFPQHQKRLALYGKLEAKSDDQYYVFISASYFGDTLSQSFNREGPFITATRVTGATATTGNFTNATAESYFEDYDLKRQTTLIGSGLDYRIGERTSVSLRAGFTRYDHDELLYRSERFQVGGISGAYDISGDIPTATFTPQSVGFLANPGNWLHRTGANRTAFSQAMPHLDNVYNGSFEINSNAQDFARGFGVRAGVSWRLLDRDFNQTTDSYSLPAGVVYRLSDVLHPTNRPAAPTGLGSTFIDHEAYKAFLIARGVFTQNAALTTDYKLKEEVSATFVTGQYATDKLRLLVGVRLEDTRFDNDTANTISGVITPERREHSYTEILPNVQLSYEARPGMILRAAYTETLARPDFADFANGLTVSFNSSGVEINSGANPYLAPRTSENLDLGAEYYFGGGFVSLGLFTKDLSNETFRQVRETRDASGVLTLIETVPLNTGSAKLEGFEVNVVKERFDFLPGPLANFGLNTNYTRLNGDWNVVFTDGTTRTVSGLRNQPEWLGNVVLTYNQDRFGANLGYRMRGRTFTGTFGATAASDIWVDKYAKLDAQVTYKLAPQVTLFAEAKNLTDAYWLEQTGVNASAFSSSSSPGRSFWLGVSMKR